jgi:hypothetical protein
MTVIQSAPANATDAIVAQVLANSGDSASLTRGNRLVEYQPPKTEIWLEQRIWGHRFHNDQTPWLLLLETLNIIGAFAADKNLNRIFTGLGGTHEGETYEMLGRSNLRHLLFGIATWTR